MKPLRYNLEKTALKPGLDRQSQLALHLFVADISRNTANER
jgi:hypothetical protein